VDQISTAKSPGLVRAKRVKEDSAASIMANKTGRDAPLLINMARAELRPVRIPVEMDAGSQAGLQSAPLTDYDQRFDASI
jgi:hypothetical protein